VGKFRDNTFRGPGTDGDFQGFVGGPGASGDPVFQRFAPDGGALFLSKPTTALSLFLMVNPGWDTWRGNGTGEDAAETWKKLQAGFAYDIEGIGLARAQFIGNENTGSTDQVTGKHEIKASRIEAAFKFTMVEGLTADLGAKFYLPVDEEIPGLNYTATYTDNIQINLAGSYASGDFGLTYGLYSGFGGTVKSDAPGAEPSKLGATFNMILVPSYYVAAIDAKLGADLGLKIVGNSKVFETDQKDGWSQFGFGAWVERGLGSGSIKIGAAYALPKNKNTDGTKGETGYFSLPIILHVSY
jgi:hypothetical protein